MQPHNSMNISVFGLGYVGCVSLGCLAQAGHHVIGVDVKKFKVEQIQSGLPTIYEPGIDDLIRDAHSCGRITATSDAEYAVVNSEVSIITVGTPRKQNGELELAYIYRVAKAIGHSLKKIDHHHSIAIRSTVKPGTCHIVMEIIEQHSGKQSGKDFSVVANPEFLREGSAIKDYFNPPYVLIGADDPRDAEKVAAVYSSVEAEIIRVSLLAAEIIKYVNNSWHALKVTFGNEVTSICKALNINSQEVMDIFIRDTELNISPCYLRPGFAYGGSCLPKDLSAFVALAKAKEVKTPVLESIKISNDQHIYRAIELIKAQGRKKLSILGLTFKDGTDDMRNSPIMDVIDILNRDGYDIRIYDDDINSSFETGRNKDSHISILGGLIDKLVTTPKALMEHSEVLIVAKKDDVCKKILANSHDHTIVDLVFLGDFFVSSNDYVGLAW